jgi:protein-L-isoaspartate(D-aspartate) O-methyltransferase
MDFTSARQNMVESQVRTNDVTDVRIQAAMRTLHRERFVRPERLALAYADTEVEYAPGRWLMRPRDIAKLLHAAHPRTGERALAVAAPYAAAVLAHIGLQVTALEAPGDVHARMALEEARVRVQAGDLATVPDGPYDLIVTEGAVAEAPAAWLQALAEHGRLAAVVRSGPAGKGTVFTRAGAAYGAREAFDAFPPWLPGFEPKPAFVF